MRRSLSVVLLLAAVLLLHAAAGSTAQAAVSRSQEIRAEVFRLLNDGIEAYKEGRYKEAIDALEQASDVALNSFRAYYYLGLSLKADRKYKQAIEPLSIALELDPVSLQARVALGDCYLLRGDPAEALAEYHRALTLQEDYPPAFDGLGRAAEASGDTIKAIEHFRRAIDLNPGYPDPSLHLGDLYMREGRNTEAIDLFLRAIKVRPDFAAAYNRLGVAYARQKQSNAAIAALRHAQTLEQGNAWHQVTIGGIFMELNNLIQAEREFDKARELDPDYLPGYMAKARLMRRTGRMDKAVELLEKAMTREVEAPVERTEIPLIIESYKEEIAREETLAREIEETGRAPRRLIALARLKSDQGDHARATQLLVEARDRRNSPAPEQNPEPQDGEVQEPDPGPTDIELLALICYDALKAERFEQAAGACEELLTEAPHTVDTLLNLALARIGMADHTGAEEALREANDLRPGDARPLTYLGNVYILSGRRQEAIQTLTASLPLMAEDQFERQRVEHLLVLLREAEERTR